MMSDGDEVGQEVGQHARVALTIALQIGEKFARLREDMARDAGARTAAEARELSARFDAERTAARAALQVTDRPEWWANATVQDVARVAETAEAWKVHDPIAERATAVIQREVRDRYGIDTAVLRDAAGQGRSELALAREWAATSAPEYYHRHDDDRLSIQVAERTERDVNAERILISDYRAALAGDVTAVELSAAEEWKRATDPAGFQDYRVQTSIDWADTGHVTTPEPAAIATARAELVAEWRDAVKPERARAGAELTEAHLLISEADRIDRANDHRAEDAARGDSVTENDSQPVSVAAELEARATDYERAAQAGGTPTNSPDELRELAADARAQAQLFQEGAPTTDRNAPGSVDQSPAADLRASASREAGEVLYDSAERRQATIEAMQAKEIPAHLIEARMSADTAHATPASAAVTSTARMSTVPSTKRSPSHNRSTQRGDLSR
jgi:hypothetical protein